MPDSIDRTVPFRLSGYAGMDVGCDNGLHMTEEEQHAMREPAHHGALAHGIGA